MNKNTCIILCHISQDKYKKYVIIKTIIQALIRLKQYKQRSNPTQSISKTKIDTNPENIDQTQIRETKKQLI